MINTDPKHNHTYDAEGNLTCCSLEEKVYTQAGASELLGPEKDHEHHHDHNHSHGSELPWKPYLPCILSFILLLVGLVFDHYIKPGFFHGTTRLLWFLAAYLPVGTPVTKDAIKGIVHGEFFTEFTLMVIATVGAFCIGEFPEGVAVMLFYSIGELFQSAAVNRAKKSIQALLDVRPKKATVIRGQKVMEVSPESIIVNEVIQVKAGERVALDGTIEKGFGSFNTSALTGESQPTVINEGEHVLAGMVNLDKVLEIKVIRPFNESSISKILDIVQNANSRKAQTELFIRKFSRIYTPIVVLLACAVTLLPYLFVADYVFRDWLYRALIFLVISCPCALVISIPLGYFGGIGAASRNGILFKGSNYLDLMTKVTTVVMDKTGTLTHGTFKVNQVRSAKLEEKEFISVIAGLESNSTHPIARAIVGYAGNNLARIENAEEIPGLGLKGKWNNKIVLAGNTQLLKKFNITYPPAIDNTADTMVVLTIDQEYAGYISLADEIKEDVIDTVQALQEMKIETIILSGDNQQVVNKVAGTLKIHEAYGELLPEQKVEKVSKLKEDPKKVIAFMGDGINDAPVLALSDVGIAMGGLGSDAAIETADVVIQTDQPSKLITAIKISHVTKSIVWQNIGLAFGVKVFVLALGAGGIATMWEAVFADVGVALLAILNAIRIQNKK
jgi:Cd2+/Zn2+-exporting ATPase